MVRGTRFTNIQGEPVTSGIPSFDTMVDRLRIGDNVVWQVSDLENYRYFAHAFIQAALRENRKVVYIRFADHAPLVNDGPSDVIRYHLDPGDGFESFSSAVFRIIKSQGVGTFYVFDCLSNLLSDWATDLMIGNFFVITCPYLFELNTIAYFALFRNSHSYQTVARIRETTQLLIDVFDENGRMYVHPLKAWQRYSPTMFLPHVRENGSFTAIVSSVDAALLFTELTRRRPESGKRSLDYWDRLFMEAEQLLHKPWNTSEIQDMVERICMIMVTREPRMSALVRKNFSLEDLVRLRERLIGTGSIGGKAVGMLVARKILEKDHAIDWSSLLEPHDSFYIGSDVFYTYLVQNGWWKLYMKHKTKEGYFKAGQILKKRLQTGFFPDEIREQFKRMLEYFGQSPIIVRSSSLLEDNFGNAFAGKYDSIFLANQGRPQERYQQFEDAVRSIYASTVNEDALTYRLQRGMAQADEQMALLVQRVSGSHRGHLFLPDLAGVGFSYNIYTWKRDMNPEAGMLRLVFGLGTRAVNRTEGDYPRIVALDSPLQHPHAGGEDLRRFSQREVDVLDLKENTLTTMSILDLMGQNLGISLDRIGVRDHEVNERIRKLGIRNQEAWNITFDELLSTSSYPQIMRALLKKLEAIYQYPVDTEFTVNFSTDDSYRINLLQCRPMQTTGRTNRVELPDAVLAHQFFLNFDGNFFGGNIDIRIHRIIHVRPKEYAELPLAKKFEVARLVGQLNKQITNRDRQAVMLLGPGRWGTTTPSLGVPVRFSEINNIAVLGEIAWSDGNLMPELSYGSHFFLDLVETGIFYLAVFPESPGVIANFSWLAGFKNRLEELVPEKADLSEAVGVHDLTDQDLRIVADMLKQRLICHHR
ncbi:MAG: phosphoenolpyruvate synthase [Deltaproteobacteria bacterium]|nr:phosphoenolpyruvate synthase [Deltaproteobacteria bacterium]